MKILLVSYWCVPYVGGVSTYTLSLKKGLERRGHEVEVLSHHPDGVHYHLLTAKRLLNKQQVLEPTLERVKRFYAQHHPGLDPWLLEREAERYSFEAAAAYFGLDDYDVLHAQEVISSIGLSRVKPARTPLVTTIHGALPNEWLSQGQISSKDSLAWDYAVTQDRLGAQAADLTLVPTQWMKNLLHDEFDVPLSDLTVLPLGLDVQAFRKKRRRFLAKSNPTAPQGKKLILCPGRLDEIKGQHILLEALGHLQELRDDWVCWLAGDGYMRAALEERCRELGLEEHVSFLGHRDDMPSLLEAADLVVTPSLQDNHPYSVMEAQIAGKAIVASDAGGIPELIHHRKTGLLCRAGDAKSLCDTMQQALNDEALRDDLGANARTRGLAEWSLDRMSERVEQRYRMVLNRNS
ncbi:MAG TPA: glycosyltransferase family 4 protein [Bacilli bacterium]|nr:glycosyltransferase family 4 protein [Bacilli bacterium]